MDAQIKPTQPTVGSLFAGIGGFDLGFEQAGFKTEWQVEIDPVCREVLADRFPHAQQFEDVRTVLPELWHTDVIIGGFPCQDVSTAGKRRGLHGKRTGLFFDAMRIVATLKPRWLVLENVVGLINSNHGRDLQTVIETLAQCGYVGFWRVLDSRYFGVPTKRRRVFIVAGFGQQPPLDFMGDAGAVGCRDSKVQSDTQWSNPFPTQLAGLGSGTSIDLGLSNIIAVEGARHKMVERQRASEDYGFCRGLDETNFKTARAAGNAVCPPVARWVAEKLITTFH